MYWVCFKWGGFRYSKPHHLVLRVISLFCGRDEVPALIQVALAIFSIVPSEASVERSFSHQSSVFSDLRTRLDDSTVEAIEQDACQNKQSAPPLMTVRMNSKHFLIPPSTSSAKRPKQQ